MTRDEQIRQQRQDRARLTAEAARLARDPAAGPYLFGALAVRLDQDNRLSWLRDAVETAAEFAEADRAPGPDPYSADAIRQASRMLEAYVAEWPNGFGCDAREIAARAGLGLDAAADFADLWPEYVQPGPGSAAGDLQAHADPQTGGTR